MSALIGRSRDPKILVVIEIIKRRGGEKDEEEKRRRKNVDIWICRFVFAILRSSALRQIIFDLRVCEHCPFKTLATHLYSRLPLFDAVFSFSEPFN